MIKLFSSIWWTDLTNTFPRRKSIYLSICLPKKICVCVLFHVHTGVWVEILSLYCPHVASHHPMEMLWTPDSSITTWGYYSSFHAFLCRLWYNSSRVNVRIYYLLCLLYGCLLMEEHSTRQIAKEGHLTTAFNNFVFLFWPSILEKTQFICEHWGISLNLKILSAHSATVIY